MTEPLTLIATLKAKPGLEDELGRHLVPLIVPTRREPGCISYDLHRAKDDKAVWLFYENWRSKADLDAHLASPHLQALLRELPRLLAEELKLEFFALTVPRAG